MIPATRKEAIELGAKHYVGRTCLNGHSSKRYASTKACVECNIAYKRSHADENRDKARASCRKWYAENPDKHRESSDKWKAANKDKVRGYKSAWKKRNPGHNCAQAAKRKAAKLHRTPAWADFGAIREFYENCPPGHHVDHKIPLQGKLISGLHVLENLQYLTMEENLQKGNSWSQ